MAHASVAQLVRTARVGHAAVVALDRPGKLHALSALMVSQIRAALQSAERDESVRTVVLTSVPGGKARAFCAGGDIVEVTQYMTHHDQKAYFKHEYELNGAIATFGKPLVVLMDGITFGGGAGLAMHAPLRVATENTRVAMPECSIGFYPDVASSFFLPRRIHLPPGYDSTAFSRYLMLTGRPICGYDNLRLGLATHYVPVEQLPSLIDELGVSHDARRVIDAHSVRLEGWTGEYSDGILKTITNCFSTSCDYMSNLHQAAKSTETTGRWAVECIAVLKAMCPSSLVAANTLLDNPCKTLGHALRREYTLSVAFVAGHIGEFAGGVKAKLVDRKAPAWQIANEVDPTPYLVPDSHLDVSACDHMADYKLL